MEDDMQAVPPILSHSESRERERESVRTSTPSPQLQHFPSSQDQISRPSSRSSDLHPSRSTTPSSARHTSPYPSALVSTPSNNLLSPDEEEGEDGEPGGLSRQTSTRLETATTIRQPSFPQFRNSIITKPSMSIITRPGIIHMQPSQPLARNFSRTTPIPISPSSTDFGSQHEPGSPVLGSNRESRVSVVSVTQPSSSSGLNTAGSRTSAQASLLAGPGPAIVRPSGARPILAHSHTDPGPEIGFPEENNETEDKSRFLDMKVEQILGPIDDQRPNTARRSMLGLQDVKKMIGDMKQGEGGSKKSVKEKRDDGEQSGKEFWQSMYSMSGETLGGGSRSGSGSRLGSRRLETPDRLTTAETGEYSPSIGTNGEVQRGKRGAGSGSGWWKRCLGG